MTERLCAVALTRLPSTVQRPQFDVDALDCGLVHIGIGAFHRAHQAVFTEDAIALKGGNWGIVGASLQRPDIPDALTTQDSLYTVESLGTEARYRVVGAVRQSLFAPRDRSALLSALAARQTHAVTLTISEKGYCLDASGLLDMKHPDIAADLVTPDAPHSAIGWLSQGLAQRRKMDGGPLTILSCDNLQSNGARLAEAIATFSYFAYPGLASWTAANVAFPLTLVDCIVPASDDAHRARVSAELGMIDAASVQREEFAQWVIQNRFAGPLPAWDAAGAEIVEDIASSQQLKLHVLNTAHSALAYLGLPRGYEFVRQAIADPALESFLDDLVSNEIAPALAPLDAASYWRSVKARFRNPMIDHRLAQIAEDGSLKLPQRLFPMLNANSRTGNKIDRMATIVRAWLNLMATNPSRDPANSWLSRWAKTGADRAKALDNPALFPDTFRQDKSLRRAIISDGV